ncbi:uncharacterized protein PITG_13217 [Phytophthora infestans T30-4]|uniref:Uncharacterized protein n=1 Tax=Phytophthora infestans (strain T30-4) TaxID=403677 RepID=D0NLG3_PHYIT|nr:uncharacterized protein PITG_13217 [Phytophthora infestans T30-4]EEY60510.1 conserved hypothetical protein [Phytophthora infestans T30-4]|eukprot:XP_002899883.1 conserved hypothetical protein [Phytophthora infestans T30-4]
MCESFVKLDSTNLVRDGYNSSWKYSFAGSAADFKDITCAIQLELPTAGTTCMISIALPDGINTNTDINRSIQTALVNAGAYLVDALGNNVFYIQLTENSVIGFTAGTCDLIKNEYEASGEILSAFDRGDAAVGGLISYKPSQCFWMNCYNGSRSSITMTIYIQNDLRVKFRDSSFSVKLLLRAKK